jgi:hypothetical protein
VARARVCVLLICYLCSDADKWRLEHTTNAADVIAVSVSTVAALPAASRPRESDDNSDDSALSAGGTARTTFTVRGLRAGVAVLRVRAPRMPTLDDVLCVRVR